MSAGDHWCTPDEIWEPAADLMGGIELDPFSNASAGIFCQTRYDGEDGDGFADPWMERNFVNGPWSKAKQVVERCHEMWLRGNLSIQVTPTSLNAAYWDLIREAPAICEPRRRIAFLRDGKPVKGNRQDVVIVCWHPDVWRFRALYRSVGETRFS